MRLAFSDVDLLEEIKFDLVADLLEVEKPANETEVGCRSSFSESALTSGALMVK